MSPKDPFLSIRETYDSLLKEYESVIVSSFDVDDFRKCSEILFSAHSCGIEGYSFTVDETRELKEKGCGVNLMAVWEGYYPLYRRTLQPPHIIILKEDKSSYK